MVASTNHLDKLDAGLSSRPSRFDRKYLFPLPSEEERNLYCQYWRKKLKAKKVDIEFPKKICPAVAIITDEFSFAYMQEAFVATLLAIALSRSEPVDGEPGKDERIGEFREGRTDKDLNDYELWREIKKTVKALRDDMGNALDRFGHTNGQFENALALEKEEQAPTAASEDCRSVQAKCTPQPTETAFGTMREPPCVQGKALNVDFQGLPIITDEKTFMLSTR